MNLNEIYVGILKFDLGAAAGNDRQALLQAQAEAQLAATAAVAVLGLLLCLFGLKLVRVWAALIGLAAGALAGFLISEAAGLNTTAALVVMAAAGLLLAVLGAALYRVGVFITVFFSVARFALHVVSPGAFLTFFYSAAGAGMPAAGPSEWIPLAVCAGTALVAAVLAVRFITPVTILGTVLCGAVLAGPSVYSLLPETGLGAVLSVILCAVFAALGVLVQLLLESRKRKRQSLKKAAQIREENSTANEVERARAMMEELDGPEAPEETERD